MADKSSCIFVASCLGGNKNKMPQRPKDTKVHQEPPNLNLAKRVIIITFIIY